MLVILKVVLGGPEECAGARGEARSAAGEVAATARQVLGESSTP